MATQVTNYQCPACTGPLHFSGTSGKLECEYCGTSYDVAEIEQLYTEKEQAAEDACAKTQEAQTGEAGEWDTSDLSQDWGEDEAQMRAYSCPSCGAELVCDATTAVTSCPYCGNPTVVPGQFGGTLKPDYVIPFQLDREAAVQALKQHYKGKLFLPKAFAQENHIQEIKGIYVPFWLFDSRASGSVTYEATTKTTHEEGDYKVTTTRHYKVYREGHGEFEKIPTDASRKMPDAYMDAIEPFDYKDLKPFSIAYLLGYLADKYDVTAEEDAQRAIKRAESSFVERLKADVTGYETCTLTGLDITLKPGKVHYAMLPVWILNTTWKGKAFLFAMNGQTGKLVGDLPTDWGKFIAVWAAITAVASSLIFFLIRWLNG